MSIVHHVALRYGAVLATLAAFSAAGAASTLTSCAKSSDIDGKGTSQFIDSNGWIFETWGFQDTYKFTAADSLSQLNQALKACGSTLILVPVPSRAVRYAGNLKTNNDAVTKFSAARYAQSWSDMLKDVRATGVTVVDLLPTIQGFKTSARGEAFFYPRDHHWTTSGAEAGAQQVASVIKQLSAANKIALEAEKNTLSFKSTVDLSGSFGDRYATACGQKPPPMKRFDATLKTTSSTLLDTPKTAIGIFGDSFGQAYPDNNFSPLLEHATQLPTANYSVSGGGPTVALAGYLADSKVRAQLPPFLVVPFQNWVSNNYFDYGQITAALVGCDAKRMIDTLSTKQKSDVLTFTPKQDDLGSVDRILHVTTSVPTNYFEVRGKYADGSDLRFEIYRTTADYYKGSRTELYAVLPSKKAIQTANFKIEGYKDFSGSVEVCSLN